MFENGLTDYILWFEHLPTPSLLITAMFSNTFLMSSVRGPCSSSPNVQNESFEFFWPVEIWYSIGGGNYQWMARAHAISMATVWSFSWLLSGLQCTQWRSGQVADRGKVNRIRSLSLFLSLSLPSADPASGFDWISRELMRQAWRKASVVEISYHILICSLCEWCMRVILCCF